MLKVRLVGGNNEQSRSQFVQSYNNMQRFASMPTEKEAARKRTIIRIVFNALAYL